MQEVLKIRIEDDVKYGTCTSPVTVNTECDLLEPSFMPVAAVARFIAPSRKNMQILKV